MRLESYKKGLLRNLKHEEYYDPLDFKKFPFWKDVFCKDFSKQLDEIYGQNQKSKEEILQMYHIFQWCQKSTYLWPNQFKLDLNFGEILYCFMTHDLKPIYEEIPEKIDNYYDEVSERPTPRTNQIIQVLPKQDTIDEEETKTYQKETKIYEKQTNIHKQNEEETEIYPKEANIYEKLTNVYEHDNIINVEQTKINDNLEMPTFEEDDSNEDDNKDHNFEQDSIKISTKNSNTTDEANSEIELNNESKEDSIINYSPSVQECKETCKVLKQNMNTITFDNLDEVAVEKLPETNKNCNDTKELTKCDSHKSSKEQCANQDFSENIPHVQHNKVQNLDLIKTDDINVNSKNHQLLDQPSLKLLLVNKKKGANTGQIIRWNKDLNIQKPKSTKNARLLSMEDISRMVPMTKKEKRKSKKSSQTKLEFPKLLKLKVPLEPQAPTYPEITYFQGSLVKANEPVPIIKNDYQAGQYDKYLTDHQNSSNITFASFQFSIRRELDNSAAAVQKIDASTATESKKIVDLKTTMIQTEEHVKKEKDIQVDLPAVMKNEKEINHMVVSKVPIKTPVPRIEITPPIADLWKISVEEVISKLPSRPKSTLVIRLPSYDTDIEDMDENDDEIYEDSER